MLGHGLRSIAIPGVLDYLKLVNIRTHDSGLMVGCRDGIGNPLLDARSLSQTPIRIATQERVLDVGILLTRLGAAGVMCEIASSDWSEARLSVGLDLRGHVALFTIFLRPVAR